MPFCYSEEEIEWPEEADDDWEPPEPIAADFQYLAPPEFGGAKDPVPFSIAPADSREARKAEKAARRKVPLTSRFLMWFVNRSIRRSGYAEQARQEQERLATSRANLFSTLVPAMLSVGVTSVRCAYDGGNDEGFAWMESCNKSDGNLSKDDLVKCLMTTDVVARLKNVELIRSNNLPDDQALMSLLDDWLATEWACLLLGDGFGTGNYTMYGAFNVDLQLLTITDDRNATVPKDGNISIAEGNH